MTHERVEWRGMWVAKGWPEEFAEAQTVRTCMAKGIEMPRIPYGDEDFDWGAAERPCHDCGALKGELHGFGCDVEECPGCSEQRLSCDCEPLDDLDDEAV